MSSPQAAPPPRSEYLYILLNEDLSPGQKLAQTAHASSTFGYAHPWARPGYVVVLDCPLVEMIHHAAALPDSILVQEPDLDNIPTALALLGGDYWPRLAHLKLAGKPPLE